jgi:transmembrane sensor
MFYVAKDAARPFLVETEIATARAVGTAFAVTRIESDGSVLVTVREGAVAVSKAIPQTEAVDAPENAMRGQPARVSAGEQAAVNRTASIHVQPLNVEQVLDWAMESLVLRGTLGEAIRSLNLRNRQQLAMTDAVLEKRRYAGVVSGWDPQAFAQTVALQLGLQAVTVGNTTYLTPLLSEVDESTATESER